MEENTGCNKLVLFGVLSMLVPATASALKGFLFKEVLGFEEAFTVTVPLGLLSGAVTAAVHFYEVYKPSDDEHPLMKSLMTFLGGELVMTVVIASISSSDGLGPVIKWGAIGTLVGQAGVPLLARCFKRKSE